MRPIIAPVGIGDLKVTKQQLVKYEAGEVAHIENVLATERRGRSHRRLRQVEEILVLEKEREEESRRDLQSTERFEIETESQRTIKSETSFEAGLEVSGGYGPVDVTAFAKFGTSDIKEESDTNSTKYAKEVVEKTISRLVERVREERRQRTLEEVEETNTHGFRNDSGDNIAGVYRWVDKLYRQKVVNYGKRLMYQFSVPEPAAFYLFAERYNYESKVLPTKPTRPTVTFGEVLGIPISMPLTPDAIDSVNYLSLAGSNGATGVEPPPPETIILSKTISREIPSAQQSFAFTNEDINIPKGYQATMAMYARNGSFSSGDPKRALVVVMADNMHTSTGWDVYLLNNVEGKLSFSGHGFGYLSFVLVFEVTCKRKDEALQQWQLATYEAIMNAYRQQLLDYEERIAAIEIQQGVAIGGSNPMLNREMEKEELKRACLTLWAGSAIDLPDGITQSGPDNPPEIQRTNAAANMDDIDFFERAFDWRNMGYTLHPYFWGRESTWLDRNALKSADPLLEHFLKAGAATVTVPVQPSFTEAVLWYQLTGDIWTGGPVPDLESTGSPDAMLYNSYLTEVEDETDTVDIDVEVVIAKDDPDAWVVRLPTTLTWLQPGPELPDLEKE